MREKMPVIDLSSIDLKTLHWNDIDWRKFIWIRDHPMRAIYIEKVVVNIGVGTSGEKLEKAAKVLEELTGQTPSLRKARKSIKEWGVRRGEPIGVMVTLRRNKAIWFLLKTLAVLDFTLRESQFDNMGNVSYGIREHILIPGVKYDPNLGIWGMDIAVRLARPGYRVMYRKRCRSKVGKNHRVTKQEAIEYFKEILGVKVV